MFAKMLLAVLLLLLVLQLWFEISDSFASIIRTGLEFDSSIVVLVFAGSAFVATFVPEG